MEAHASLESAENAQIHRSVAKTSLLVVIWARGGTVAVHCHTDINKQRRVVLRLARAGLLEEHFEWKTA